MSRDRFRHSGSLQHHQLGKDCDSLCKDTEAPENFDEIETIIEYEGQDDTRHKYELQAEGVDARVIGRPVFT
jgi:hypothetical protein